MRALRSAQHLIYLESQFLWSPELVAILRAKLGDPPSDEFRVVVVLPARPNNGADDTRGQLGVLVDADRDQRLLACTLYQPRPREQVYVHAKIGIVDDRWLAHRLGEPERALVLQRHRGVRDHAATRRSRATTRLRLWREHLRRDDVDGEPHEVIDELWRPTRRGRRVRPARAPAARLAARTARSSGRSTACSSTARVWPRVEKVLVANRGEIALRVFRAARELGLGDGRRRRARRRRLAARALGRRDGRDRVVPRRRRAHPRGRSEPGADAVHPGYGFLAESGDFAEAVLAAGLTWVGPPPDALRAGGDKLAAKRIARRGRRADGPRGDGSAADREGGGGRRRPRHAHRARSRAELDEALEAARREAQAGVRRRPRLPRALPRAAAARRDPAARRRARHRALARRARVLGAAPPSEGARGVAVPGARRRAARSDERRRGPLRPRRSATSARARPSSCSTAATSTSSS